MRWYNTSLGKKFIMAITGLLMVLFVVAHMLGNMSIFGGENGLNAYAEHLRAFPPALWAFRAVMVGAFLVHIWMGLSLYLENKAARPVQYAKKVNDKTTFSAQTMIWTGLILGAFIVYHLLHFTLHAVPGVVTGEDAEGRFNVFAMVVDAFRNFPITLVYVAAMVVLLLHLRHGIQSFFQSLGLTNDSTQPKLVTGGRWVAGVVAIGFLAIPVLIFFKAIGG
jgi:succinate dehydrogenase / fumarate reductase cytochrome b subunit